MSDDITKELLIRISANMELLRSNLNEAGSVIDQFDRKATAASENVGKALQKTGHSAAAQQAGIKQLGQQFGDLSLQLGQAASSAKPAQLALLAFAQQGQQIAGALDLATGGTSKLAAFLGGPWGIAITAGAAALGPLIQGLIDTAMGADKATNALDDLIKKRRQEQAERNKVSDATGDLNQLRERRTQLQARIRLVGVRGPNGQLLNVFKELRDLAEVNRQIAEGENAINDERQRRVDSVLGRLGVSDVLKKDGPKTPRVRTPRTPRATVSAFDRFLGGIESDTSADLSRAMQERINRINEANQDLYNDQIKLIRRNADYEYGVKEQGLRDELQARQRQLSTLADTYEDLFRGGTKVIWDNFEQRGMRAAALVLAAFTQAKLNKKSFGFGDALDIGISSLFGGFYANGGRPPLGRVSVVGERGPELFVPDVSGTIIPNGGFGGGNGVVVNITAPGATMETIAIMRREIANAAPVIAAAATGQTVRVLNRRQL